MKLRILKLTVILCLALVLVQVSASAQKVRPGSDTENMVLSAVSLLNENDVEGAREILLSLLAQDAENDAAWYYLATTALAVNDLSQAEEYLKTAVSLDPDNFCTGIVLRPSMVRHSVRN